MNTKKKVCIIGSGVSGLSTAYVLLKLGWEVTILSKDDPATTGKDPAFSSLFPAASIIPRSVYSKNLNSLFIKSQQYFQQLHENQFPGLQINEHFELFTENRPKPYYAEMMDQFEMFEDFKNGFYPQHPELSIVSGWKFNCFFADWNLYFPALLKKTLDLGAELKIKTLSQDELLTLPFEYVVNCSELGSQQLFADQNNLIYRGHLVQVLEAPRLVTPDGKNTSYNFYPGKEIYKTERGTPQDIYCYSRSDGWIFGGSRQQGKISENGQWKGEENKDQTHDIDGTKVPAQIINLHSEIIEHTFKLHAQDYPKRKAKLGYRYVRKEEEGLRLETEENSDKLFIHNYGHGGAGVTLSWGCALKVAQMLSDNLN